MKILLFVPSYNDATGAARVAAALRSRIEVTRTLIVDDSDAQDQVEAARSLASSRVEVIQRNRQGKWSAWRIALERARGYDALLQADSDVEITNPAAVTEALETSDVVTCHPHVSTRGEGYVAKALVDVYERSHRQLQARGKFNMGGQVIALRQPAAEALRARGFFNEPVQGDDHTICLAAAALGFRCTSVDGGLRILLPASVDEWIRYRSRHKSAIQWAEHYVAEKTGSPEAARDASRRDFEETARCFLWNTVNPPRASTIPILLLAALSAHAPAENPAQWTPLKTTKRDPPPATKP